MIRKKKSLLVQNFIFHILYYYKNKMTIKIDSSKCITYCKDKYLKCTKQCNQSVLKIVKKSCRIDCTKTKNMTFKDKRVCRNACKKIELWKPKMADEWPVNEKPKILEIPDKKKVYLTESIKTQTSFNGDSNIYPITGIYMNMFDSKSTQLNETNLKPMYYECPEQGAQIVYKDLENTDLNPTYILKTLVNADPSEKKYMCSLLKQKEFTDDKKNIKSQSDSPTNFEVFCVNGKTPENGCV